MAVILVPKMLRFFGHSTFSSMLLGCRATSHLRTVLSGTEQTARFRTFSLNVSPRLRCATPGKHISGFPNLLFYRRRHSDRSLVQTASRKLLQYIDAWETDKAVAFVSDCMDNNKPPSGDTILKLIQHLGSLGDVEALLKMKDQVVDSKLCSADSFYMSLAHAYKTSGRIVDGMDYVKQIYQEAESFDRIEPFFIKLVVSVVSEFPDSLAYVLKFIDERKGVSDHLPLVALWKCFIYCGQFEQAVSLIASRDKNLIEMHTASPLNSEQDCHSNGDTNNNREELSNSDSPKNLSEAVKGNGGVKLEPLLRAAVSDIVMNKDRTEHDRISVLKYLSEQTFLRMKLQARVFATLLSLLEEEGRNEEIELVIERATALGLEERILKITE